MSQTSLDEAKTLVKQAAQLTEKINEAQTLRAELTRKAQELCPHPQATGRKMSVYRCCKVCGKLLSFGGR